MSQSKRKSALCIRVDPDELRTIDTISATKGCQRSEWVREVLSAAVRTECLAIVSSRSDPIKR